MPTHVRWIKLVFIISSMAKCFAVETRDLHIGLDSYGRLTESSEAPACCIGEIILLKSYIYEYRECQFIDDCDVSNKLPLLPVEELLLHEMCSLQVVCRNLSFPLRNSIQRNKTNAIRIRYQCIDPSANVIDICKHQDGFFHDTIYFTTIAKAMSQNTFCMCTINNGNFSLSLDDVRLKAKANNNCSPARLHINTGEYVCVDGGDFASRFAMQQRWLSNAFILLKFNSENTEPEMVWLTVKPKDSVSVHVLCSGNPRLSTVTAGTTRVINQALTDSSYASTSSSRDEQECRPDFYKLYGGCVAFCPEHYYEDEQIVQLQSTLNSATTRPKLQRQGICNECNKACRICKGPLVSDCVQCSDEFERRDNLCQKKLPLNISDPVQTGFIVWSILLHIVLAIGICLYVLKTGRIHNFFNSNDMHHVNTRMKPVPKNENGENAGYEQL